ncbi:MAG: trigger factor [Betaproteobacteria bacterium]|nr:trigger factor [Betaproteobacteria bacterium]
MQTNQENSAVGVSDNNAAALGAAVSALERRLDMSVSMADIDQDVQQRLKHLARTVRMAGFRPGKVPFKMVEQQYGPQARSEAISAAVDKVFGDKVREQKLRIAGQPRIEAKDSNGKAQIEFSAVFEVYPEIKLGDVSGHEIVRPVLTVTDAELDQTIEVLRKQRTTYVEVARPGVSGDRMVIDFIGRRDGEKFPGGEGTDFAMHLGDGQMLPDFDAAINGMSAGETKTFDLTFPAEYQAKDLAGQTVQFEVTVKRVEQPQLPELDAEFAQALGITDGDLARMRDEVRENLEREVTKRLQVRIKNQVMDTLLAVNPVTAPKSLVESESRQMAEAALRDLESRGMSARNVPVEPSWFTEQATRRVSLGLLLSEVVKENQLFAKPEQVRAVIDDFAVTYEDPAEVVRWYYSQPQRMSEAEALVVENNVVEWVLANAKVIDKPIAFDELMGNGA